MANPSGTLPLSYAWRSLRRAPVFTITAVLTLALGVGAVTAIFSVVNAVLIRSLPYPDADRLAGFGHSAPGLNMAEIGQSLGTYGTYQRVATSFEAIGMWARESVNLSDPAGGAEPERVLAAAVTPSMIPLLRINPLRGRSFTDDEGRPNGASVILLSEDFWRRRFGADPALVGRTVQVDGRSAEVVGIMPAAFQFPDVRTQAWIPIRIDPAGTDGGGFNWSGIARLKPGVTLATAQRDLERGLLRVPDFFPMLAHGMPMAGVIQNAKIAPNVRPLRTDVVGPFAPVLWVVAATAVLVLLVACTNVANLLLVRAEGRQKELTVRAALGANRGQVLAHFISESMLLALLGGGVGIVLAIGGVAWLVQRGPTELPRLAEVSVDWVALTVGVTAAVVASFGLAAQRPV